MRRLAPALTATAVLLAAACGSQDPDPGPPTTGPDDPSATDDATAPGSTTSDDDPVVPGDPNTSSDAAEVEVVLTDVATGLEAPWDVAFLDDGRTFVTERDRGRLLELDDGELTEVRTFEVDATGEGGLLGLVTGPDGDDLYAYYTGADDNRVVRFDPDRGPEEVVLAGIPKASTHNGGRLAFGPDGMLYVATGDAQDLSAPPDPASLAGKVLRVTPDGDVPDDNPTAGSPVWSLGHRNVQGLGFDADGTLFAVEFGPDVDDEVNRIEPGGDYGWPEVTGEAGHDAYVDPVFVRQPDEASWSGGTVLRDGAIPRWEGDLFVASLRGERLWRLRVEDGEVVDHEQLLTGELGRLRTVEQAPDGSLWLLTSNRDGRGTPADGDDRIVRYGPG